MARYLRAFRERRLSSAVYWVDSDQDLERVALLVRGLESRGFKAGAVTLAPIQTDPNRLLWLRRVGAFLIAGVLTGFLFIRFPTWAPLYCLSGGILCWMMLQTDAFRFQTQSLYIVKTAYLMPFLFSIVRRRNWRSVAALGLLFFVFLRLEQHLPVPQWEHAVRDWIEVEIGVRPRLTEIFGWFSWFSGWPTLSLFAPAATMNSFLHAQAPLQLILIRSFTAFGLAGLLSLVFRHARGCGHPEHPGINELDSRLRGNDRSKS